MRIHYFQHVPFEGLALLAEWAIQNNHSMSGTCFFESDYTIPSVDEFDMLIVLGGPMSANDNLPWLKSECALIKEAISRKKYVLGICLGAQLIAKTLGARVAPNIHKEIGWYPIAFSDDIVRHPLLCNLSFAVTVLHWHGEYFQIPSEAIPIANSAACVNQGFLYKQHVLALQFHIEMNPESTEKIVEACKGELDDNLPYIQSAQEIIEKSKRYHLKQILFQMLDNWMMLND